MSKGLFTNCVNSSNFSMCTDAMWAEWGIHHFHLVTDPKNERADWLLFAKVNGEQVLFIDVRRHSEDALWTQAEICLTLLNDWPQQSGIADLAEDQPCQFLVPQLTAEDRQKMRKAGINHAITHNNRPLFRHRGGLTLAGTSLEVSMKYIHINRCLMMLAKWLEDGCCPLRVELAQRGISQPNFHLKSVNNRLVIACDEKPSEVWASNKSENDCLGWIESMVLPDRPMPINPYQKKAA